MQFLLVCYAVTCCVLCLSRVFVANYNDDEDYEDDGENEKRCNRATTKGSHELALQNNRRQWSLPRPVVYMFVEFCIEA